MQRDEAINKGDTMTEHEAIEKLYKIGLRYIGTSQCEKNGTLRFYDPQVDCRYTLNERTGYYRRELNTRELNSPYRGKYGRWERMYINPQWSVVKSVVGRSYISRTPILVHDLELQVTHVVKLVKHHREWRKKHPRYNSRGMR